MSLLTDGLPGLASYPEHDLILSAVGLTPSYHEQNGPRHNLSAGHLMQIIEDGKSVILGAVSRALKKDVIGGPRSVNG
ncbi:MAG: hypothetical protein CMM45_08050 [Rhodospirillaceae bacterium]|nr:hypothetical protein [Rhodospirillaceae bacterium]